MSKKLSLILAACLALTACNKIEVGDEQIKKAVAEVLKENPQLVADAIKAAGGGAGAQRPSGPDEKTIKANLKKYEKELFNNSDVPFIGKENAKNVIVEFFDYNCGYCKRVLPTVQTLANEHDSKVILMDMAILGPNSQLAGATSLAVHDIEPAKYIEFHTKMMEHQGSADENAIKGILTSIGMNADKVLAEAKNEKYAKMLTRHAEIAQSFGIGGTPSFIVNGNVVKGAVPLEAFKANLK
jgi:protein-disulfide isomerase